jgi:hypothetical protein
MLDASAIAKLMRATMPSSIDGTAVAIAKTSEDFLNVLSSHDVSELTMVPADTSMETRIPRLTQLQDVVAGIQQHQVELERRQKNILMAVQQLTIHLLAVPDTATPGISGVMSEVGRLLKEMSPSPPLPTPPTPGTTPFLDAIK